jgi:hypothetical protein
MSVKPNLFIHLKVNLHDNLFIRMTIILKLNTIESKPDKYSTVSSLIAHNPVRPSDQTTAMGNRLICHALFVPQHHSHKLVTPRTPISTWGVRIFPVRFESASTTYNYVYVSRNLMVEHWDPQSDHRWQVAMLTIPQSRHQELKKVV